MLTIGETVKIAGINRDRTVYSVTTEAGKKGWIHVSALPRDVNPGKFKAFNKLMGMDSYAQSEVSQRRARERADEAAGFFPSEFIGQFKWKNEGRYNTFLSFTANTVGCNQEHPTYKIVSVSGNSYSVRGEYSEEIRTLNIRIVDGGLEISEDSDTGDNNWNGIWKEEIKDVDD